MSLGNSLIRAETGASQPDALDEDGGAIGVDLAGCFILDIKEGHACTKVWQFCLI